MVTPDIRKRINYNANSKMYSDFIHYPSLKAMTGRNISPVESFANKQEIIDKYTKLPPYIHQQKFYSQVK